jgi:hypothetical protein
MPFEERIFLEMTTAVGPNEIGGHMYLVKRSVFVENNVVLSNDYDAVNDQVIRGSWGFSLGTYIGHNYGDSALNSPQ